MKRYISTSSIGTRSSCGIGYVIIPAGEDRNKYIRFCYSTGTLSIVLNNGGVLDKVMVSQHLWNYIEFPKDSDQLGSLVSWQNLPYENYPIIIGVFGKKNDIIDMSELSAKISKGNKRGAADVRVDGATASIYVNADSLTESGGDIYVRSKNGTSTSKISIDSSGSIQVSSQQARINVTDEILVQVQDPKKDETLSFFSYKKDVGFTYEDEFENKITIEDGMVNIDSDNINLGASDAKEPILLGDTTVSLIDEILTILGKTTVATAIGPSPLITGPEFLQLKTKLESLKSKKHKIE